MVRLRARSQDGFGLVELLMAMVMLNIGVLAIVAAFQSGAIALRRASTISTAAALAEIQMERYRGLRYAWIALDGGSVAAAAGGPGGATYTADAAYTASQVTTTCASPLPVECQASRTLLGPDNKRYRVDVYIAYENSSSDPVARIVKKVTVVVRDGVTPTPAGIMRVSSTFDESTGS